MDNFKLFLSEATNIRESPNFLSFVRSFFNHGLDVTTLKVWGDFLEENGFNDAAELFRGLSWRDPKLKRGNWQGRLVYLFYNVFGHYNCQDFDINDSMRGSLFFHERGGHQMARHIVHPGYTSYRLSLTNGQWFAYKNEGDDRASVVSTRHRPTEDSERWYPQRRITLRDYSPVDVNEIPENLLWCAFSRIIERQVRGGH